MECMIGRNSEEGLRVLRVSEMEQRNNLRLVKRLKKKRKFCKKAALSKAGIVCPDFGNLSKTNNYIFHHLVAVQEPLREGKIEEGIANFIHEAGFPAPAVPGVDALTAEMGYHRSSIH